ncbi:MAG: hypothetical protein ACFFFG_17220 [Candidatus Thorarchaeota archaeon]
MALKRYDQTLSLGVLFFAVQLVDIAFFLFLILGIENARLVPGFTEASFFDLYDLPFTHSLLGTLLWAIASFSVFRYVVLRTSSKSDAEKTHTSLLIGIAVFSHYVVDFLVHTPDLLIIPGIDFKIGLGVWNFLLIALTLEAAFLVGGFLIYTYSTSSGTGFVSRYGMHLFILVLIVGLLTFVTSSPPPGIDLQGLALGSEFFYLAFAGVAFWLDRARNPINS